MDPNNPQSTNPEPQYPPTPPDPGQIIAADQSVNQEEPISQAMPEPAPLETPAFSQPETSPPAYEQPVVVETPVVTEPVSDSPPPPPDKPKSSIIPLILSVLITAVLFGAGGFFLGQQTSNNATASPSPTPQLSPSPLVEATESPSPTNNDTTPGWQDYSIPEALLSFRYPPTMAVSTDVQNTTALKATKEYWVAIPNSGGGVYLQIFLYPSSKTSDDWWDTEGKVKFDKLADDVEAADSSDASVNLTYEIAPIAISGKDALEVIVNSDYDTPQTPTKRYLSIISQNNYIVMASYQELGTEIPSLSLSKQILSTFKLTN